MFDRINYSKVRLRLIIHSGVTVKEIKNSLYNSNFHLVKVITPIHDKNVRRPASGILRNVNNRTQNALLKMVEYGLSN